MVMAVLGDTTIQIDQSQCIQPRDMSGSQLESLSLQVSLINPGRTHIRIVAFEDIHDFP